MIILPGCKVALLTKSRPGTGFGRRAHSIYKHLPENVDFYYYDFPGEDIGNLPEREDVNTINIPEVLAIKNRDLNRALRNIFKIPRKYIPEGYDIYHFSDPNFFTFFPEIKGKTVVTCHDMYPYLGFEMPIFTKMVFFRAMKELKKVDKVICVSKNTKRDLINITGNFEDSKVVYNAIDKSKFKPRPKKEARRRLSLPQDKFLMLHVGSEAKSKNVGMIISAFEKINKEYPETLLLRVGPQADRITEDIRKKGLDEKVVRPGIVSDEELIDYYSSSDLFVYPSRYEGFGLPAVEAMACGLPIIASRRGPLKEVVGDAGILVDPEVGNLVKSINKALNSDELLKKMNQNSLSRSKKYTWKKSAQKLKKIYENLTGKR